VTAFNSRARQRLIAVVADFSCQVIWLKLRTSATMQQQTTANYLPEKQRKLRQLRRGMSHRKHAACTTLRRRHVGRSVCRRRRPIILHAHAQQKSRSYSLHRQFPATANSIRQSIL